MYDGGKILTGLGVFLVLSLSPVWTRALQGKAAPPEPKIVTTAKECVAPKEVMRERHMRILDEWRNTVVRKGQRTYVDAHGATVTMSLTDGCMRCHTNKSEFCDRCHDYAAAAPYCWSCHNEPKETP